MKKLLIIIRDLTLFGLLILLIKIAIDRKSIQAPRKALYSPLNGERDTYELPEQEPEMIVFPPSDEDILFDQEVIQKVPESPQIVISYFDTVEEQINDLTVLILSTSKEAAQLKSMKERLDLLKKSYQHLTTITSDDGSLPIEQGLRQDQIENHLLRIVQLLGRILRLHAQDKAEGDYGSIEQRIRENGTLLNKLITTNPTTPSNNVL